MNKYTILLLIIAALAVSLGLNSNVSEAHRINHSAIISPNATPTPKRKKDAAEIESIELDKKEALIDCPCMGSVFSNVCGADENGAIKKDNLLINIKTIVRNPKNTTLIYEYTVSGGRIIGQGDKVSWDLEGVRPGVYTITASIKGKRNVSSETKNQPVTVRWCECDCPCICPSLDVSGGGGINPGGSVVFIANVSGGITNDITYNWTVSQGEIVSGQGTPQIKVKTTQEMSGKIIATVEISGDLCEACEKTASETATIYK